MLYDVGIQLLNFIAILQLLAGLCLLFFYDDILKRVVVTDDRNKCLIHFHEIKNHLQIEFTNTDSSLFLKFIDCKTENDGTFVALPAFRNSVSYIGKVSFVFLLCLMFIASHETPNDNISDNSIAINYNWILFEDIVLLLVGFSALKYRTSTIFAGYWNFIWVSLVLVCITILSFYFEFELGITRSAITYSTLVTLLLLTGIIVTVFEYDEGRSKAICHELENLKDDVVLYAAWAVNPNDYSAYRNMRQPFKSLFSPKDEASVAQPAVDQYVQEKLHLILHNSKPWNRLFVIPFKKGYVAITEHISLNKEYILIASFIIIYIFCIAYIILSSC